MSLDNKIALSAHYAGQGLTNAQIARLLRVDASSISRYLKQAEENRWLEKHVRARLPDELDKAARVTVRNVDLEEKLFRTFALSDRGSQREATVRLQVVVVVDTVKASSVSTTHASKMPDASTLVTEDLLSTLMGIEGGRLLLDLLSPRDRRLPTVLGIAWGRSTGSVVSSLDKMSLPALPELHVVALQGGVARNVTPDGGAEYYPDILAERLSSLFESRFPPSLVTQPAYIGASTAETVDVGGLKAIWSFILGDPSYQDANRAYESLDVALLGIGGLEDAAWAVSSGYLSDSGTVSALKLEGACGDIVCRIIRDRTEAPIEGWVQLSSDSETIRQTNLRAIGISLAQIGDRVRNGARVLAVAGGKHGAKALAISAAVRNGLVTDLVTDQETALKIIENWALKP